MEEAGGAEDLVRHCSGSGGFEICQFEDDFVEDSFPVMWLRWDEEKTYEGGLIRSIY